MHVMKAAPLAAIVVLACAASAPAQRLPAAPYAFELPIAGGGCGGFSYDQGTMYLFEYEGRQLYKVLPSGKLEPHEDVKGWYAVDVAVIDGKPIYCSRDRVFRKVRGKIEVNPIKNAQKLISIAGDDREIFLLEGAPASTVIVLDQKSGRELRRLAYDGRNPVDLVTGDGHLWVLDTGDRCIRRLDKRTGQTTLRFQAGPGVQHSTHGLLFREGNLYVHEGDHARLRRVQWKEEGHAVWSWSADLRMTFVQESWNEHDRAETTVSFKIPIPPTRSTQAVENLTWSQPPRLLKDRFGQPFAQFDDIRIPPKGRHVLEYAVDVQARAVQYDPPMIPLSQLATIDPQIRATYLASNKLYQLDHPLVKAAAKEARLGADGTEPKDVRTLITNIAEYLTRRISYRLDDTWKEVPVVLAGETGSCSEYSFVFSALCRANGIPTRLVGGLQIGDYAAEHETKGFHRWTEVWFPEIGWMPVDVTKIDGEAGSWDYEFLFGTPGYLLVLSQGDFDEGALGTSYYIWRNYRGGQRKRNNVVRIEPRPGSGQYPMVKLTK